MAEKKRDYWKWPATLILWASLGWVVWQAASTMLARNALVQDLNSAAAISDRDPKRAMRVITDVQRQQLVAGGSAERFLNLVGLKTPSFAQQYGTIYANVAQEYYSTDEIGLATSAWSLALVSNPKQQIVAQDLAAACMRLENWELGYYAGQRAGRENLKRYFAKQYKPPWG